MSGPSFSLPRPSASSKSIPSLTASSSSTLSTSFATPKSFARKKPMDLNISRSIPPPARVAPQLPLGTMDDDNSPWTSEADRLRQDIERLQLSSHSSSSKLSTSDSPPFISPTLPTTPTHLALQSDSSCSSTRKKSTNTGGKGTKRSHRDKNGDDQVKDEDLEVLADLGAGNGGTVTKVWNKKRKCVMARKLILVDAKPSVRKQIIRELQIMNDCASQYIVGYYGCFSVDVHVGVVMEFMDAGSLDHIYRNNGPVPIDVVGKVAEAVLEGLMYLYDVHRIIHRDIKPSNVLANTAGEIKICDFGVSGELINSIANTFVGTSTYMSLGAYPQYASPTSWQPERIQGAPYTIKSDVWSLGISLIELALGRFPFSDSPEEMDFDPDATLPNRPKANDGVSLGGGGHTMSILDLLQHIVNEPAPRLVSRYREFPREAVRFVEGCVDKDPGKRKSPQDLLASEWIVQSRMTKDDLKAWATSLAA